MRCVKCGYANTPDKIINCNYCGEKVLDFMNDVVDIFRLEGSLNVSAKFSHDDNIIVFLNKSEINTYTGDLSCPFARILERWGYVPTAISICNTFIPKIWMSPIKELEGKIEFV